MAAFLGLGLVYSAPAQAQNTGPLPGHAIEEFGLPPQVPDGPSSPAVPVALRLASIDSVTLSACDEDRDLELTEIAKSKDHGLVCLISDLMLFAPSQRRNDA